MTYGFTPDAKNPNALDWTIEGSLTRRKLWPYDSTATTLGTADALSLCSQAFVYDKDSDKVLCRYDTPYIPAQGWALYPPNVPGTAKCWMYLTGYQPVEMDYTDVKAKLKNLAGL